MSAVAKLLRHMGVVVTGSDLHESAMTKELQTMGIQVAKGHSEAHLPENTDLVIYTSASTEQNPEREEAKKRGVYQVNNFEFLGEWALDRHTVLVTGTHGKSTTTSMLGLMCVQSGLDPTVIVGTKVPGFPEGNLRIGSSDLTIIEGDEYARHFLCFRPNALLMNNIELDHTDVYATLDDVMNAFRDMMHQVRDGGLIVANADDSRVSTLVGQERGALEKRHVRIVTFGFGRHADVSVADLSVKPGEQIFALRGTDSIVSRYTMHIPGKMNVLNAIGALTMARELGASANASRLALSEFKGVWRRFELISEADRVTVVSDYGHHPTAVASTLDATQAFYPHRRIVLCFQPHHRNRTKHLFDEFVASFDKADALVLAEIYDVAGRDQEEDANVSSKELLQAVTIRDHERNARRDLAYAHNPEDALHVLTHWKKPGDVILVMGAGDIDEIAKRV